MGMTSDVGSALMLMNKKKKKKKNVNPNKMTQAQL